MLQFNSNYKVNIAHVGRDKTPVITIDDFVKNIDDVIANAVQNAEFSPDTNSFYPGVRAPLPKELIIEILQEVYLQLYSVYDIPKHFKLRPQASYYSLVTTPEDKLIAMQCMPHFDTPKPYYFAVLLYLNAGEHGDTAIFRHKQTQFERIKEENISTYFDRCQLYFDLHGKPPAKYHQQESPQFERYHTIKYKQNRLVIYPGNLLHSTLIQPELDIDDNPVTGRLTSNIFIDFMAPS